MIAIAGRTPGPSAFESGLKLAFIGGLHVLLIGMLATTGFRPQVQQALSRFEVRIIEARPRLQPPPIKRAPVAATPAAPVSRPAQPVSAPPVMTAPAEAPAPAQSFTVAPQPPVPAPAAVPKPVPVPVPARTETPVAPPAPPVAAPAPVTPPRFDADYLHNPSPAYPRASRLAGQQGQVMLKVLVNDQGLAVSVHVQRSSGFARLDDAALDAVRKWRFVPARRGSAAIEDWVLVPIAFRLDA
jgi:protein TonB